MRPGGSKAKGANFERKMCAFLSEWLTYGESSDVFWRSAMSGGRARVHLNNSNIRMRSGAGDISAIRGIGEQFLDKFVVECKAYKDLELQKLFYNTNSGNMARFWEQVCKDGRDFERHPMLLAKQDLKPVLVGVTFHIFQLLNMQNAMHITQFRHLNLCLVPLEQFFVGFQPSYLVELPTFNSISESKKKSLKQRSITKTGG